MHLRCVRNHFASLAGMYLKFNTGDPINTEYSYKYRSEDFCLLAGRAGLRMQRLWQDEHGHFSVMYFAPMASVNTQVSDTPGL